jgi:type IV secretion system protein VirB11
MNDASVLHHYLKPLAPLLAEGSVTDLVINRPQEIGVERAGRWTWLQAPELTPEWLSTLATAAAAHTRQDVSAQHPICSTTLPGGQRCQIVNPPAAETCVMTIRRPSPGALSLEALAAQGLFCGVRIAETALQEHEQALLELRDAAAWPAFFDLAVKSRCNILVSGATGSGKTTLAKALVARIPADERLITIEDTRELSAPHRNLVSLLYAKDAQGLSQVDPRTLLECALRMRPDRILLGELRDGVAYDYLRAISSGHPGSVTTLHADSPALAFEQLFLLTRQSSAGRDLPRDQVRRLLLLLIDVVVQMRRAEGRFRVTEVYYEPARKRLAQV